MRLSMAGILAGATDAFCTQPAGEGRLRRIISQLADCMISILHWAKTPRDVVTSAMSPLLAVTDRVGIVINKVNLAKHALYDYGDYYSCYNSYYGDERTECTCCQTCGGRQRIAKLKRIVPRVK